jgi:hypothetical protein
MVQGTMKALWYNAVSLTTITSIPEVDLAKRSPEISLSKMSRFHKSRMMRSSLKVTRNIYSCKGFLSLPLLTSQSAAVVRIFSMFFEIAGVLNHRLSLIGVCGTDAHIHDGEFISTFPVREHSASVSRLIWLFPQCSLPLSSAHTRA